MLIVKNNLYKKMNCRKLLRAVTFSEFDNIVGPQLRYQYPSQVLSNENFEALSDYVIVGKHLCGKIIVVKTDDIQFMNYSIAIENLKYDRNALLFAVGFVLDKNVDTLPFESVLSKLSQSLFTMEIEKEYLSQSNMKTGLLSVLQSVYEQLTEYGEVFLPFDEANIFTAGLFSSVTMPRKIRHSDVPILLQEASVLSDLPWDISLQHLVPWINGVRTVKLISKEAVMDIDIVERCLQMLIFYKCVILGDALKFSNSYFTTPTILQLVRNEVDLLELCHFASVNKDNVVVTVNTKKILIFLLNLKPGFKLSDIILMDPTFLTGIDLQRLLIFAQNKNYIAISPSVPKSSSSLITTEMYSNDHSNTNNKQLVINTNSNRQLVEDKLQEMSPLALPTDHNSNNSNNNRSLGGNFSSTNSTTTTTTKTSTNMTSNPYMTSTSLSATKSEKFYRPVVVDHNHIIPASLTSGASTTAPITRYNLHPSLKYTHSTSPAYIDEEEEKYSLPPSSTPPREINNHKSAMNSSLSHPYRGGTPIPSHYQQLQLQQQQQQQLRFGGKYYGQQTDSPAMHRRYDSKGKEGKGGGASSSGDSATSSTHSTAYRSIAKK